MNAGADASEPAARQEREESPDEARTTSTERSLEARPSSAADVDSDPGTEDAEILDAEASEDDSPASRAPGPNTANPPSTRGPRPPERRSGRASRARTRGSTRPFPTASPLTSSSAAGSPLDRSIRARRSSRA
ncbi:hypothetical protein [Halalkalicoccus salilacus]|uniref:hypothetical protein n=1 Tax=Halalkalicoccus sp. GCM10025704 TaxID=3252662 RepID=UPI0036210648